MNRQRWNLLLAALLLVNLLRWGVGFAPSALAHPPGDEGPPALPDSVLTLTDEEWEAEELAGTSPDTDAFVVVPYKKLAGMPFQTLDRVGARAGHKAVGNPGHTEGEGEGNGGQGNGNSVTSSLVVTKWRVKGHIHRTRTRP